MQTLAQLYAVSLEEACDIANQIQLNSRQTYIEPSRLEGYFTEDSKAAIAFRLTFSARRWPTKNDDIYLMYTARSAEVSAWIGSCGYEFETVEIVAILFGSDEDQKKFEKVIWPGR